MKKLVSLVPLMLFLHFAAWGQNENTFRWSVLPSEPVARWSFGLFAGPDNNHHVIDVAYATDMKYTDGKGLTAGVMANWHPWGWLSLRADLVYVEKNYRLDRDNRYLPFVFTEYEDSYFSFPVTAVLSFGRTFRVIGIFGGYVGYWLSGHRSGQSLSVTYLVTGSEEDTYFDSDYEFNDVRDNRFDAGLVFGTGIRCAIARKVDLSAELRWYYGLTDIQKNYMTNLNPRYNTTRTLQFGIAYWLGSSKEHDND